MAKRGPNTEAGKAAVRHNATTHALLSPAPVIDGIEDERDWLAHLSGVHHSIHPQGHLEAALADRIALLLWRLRRVTRYEREAALVGQESVAAEYARNDGGAFRSPDDAASVAEAEERIADAERLRHALNQFPDLPDDALSHQTVVYQILLQHDKMAPNRELHEDDLYEQGPLTVGLVRSWLADCQEETGVDPALAVRLAQESCSRAVEAARAAAAALVTRLDQLRRERILPSAAVLEKITRYESHLQRQLLQTLHELEALQARRLGGESPLSRLDITAGS